MNTQPGGPQNNPPKDLHTVTRCLLARFADSTSGKLKAYYLTRPREYDKPPSAVGRVEGFITHNPQEYEAYWKTEVEDFLPAAFTSVDDKTILDKPDHVKVLKDCIALHWARSKAYKDTSEALLQEVTQRQKRLWMEQHRQLLVNAFYDRYGLYPVGDQALEHINELLHEIPEVIFSRHFAERVRENFKTARNHFVNKKLEIARPPAGQQFLVGDAPALPVSNWDGQIRKAALYEANTVLLPIGPNHALGLGKGDDKWIDLEASHVELINTMQTVEAISWVYYQPSSGLGTFVNTLRRE
ncbi:DUF4238 domain-containing protein [Actinospica sp. MGRD01-02]|uniref:DUF4238 domain-containing protein n=1 Tax=Actinospica acidithermotolerans TaxID=2828514 RepID=A0A941E640_9ACTN|nr:DUF4238 domain-containing protein [Actinospica acidithermotolerans]MBR7825766.1 DUF4238 domain-containing protein [Actinospica acidithermotolerans]